MAVDCKNNTKQKNEKLKLVAGTLTTGLWRINVQWAVSKLFNDYFSELGHKDFSKPRTVHTR